MKNSQLDNSLKIIARTSFIVLITLLLSKIFTYLYRIVIARYFGPEVYGLFSLAVIIFSFFVAISSLGLTDGLLRFISLYRGKKQINKINYLLKFSLTILFISSMLFAILLFFSSDFISLKIFHNKDLIIYLKIFSFLIPVSIFANLFLSIIRAYEEVKWYSFIQNILQNIVRLAFLVFFIFLGLKSNAIIFSFFLGILSMLLVSYFICKYKASGFLLEFKLKYNQKKEITKNLFYYSWPIIFISTIGSLFYWIDSFAIGYFKSATEVGFYNAAIPIAALFAIASDIFMQLFFPLITKEYYRKNFKLIKELSKQVGKWIFIINLPLFLIIMLFPGVIINILFGKEYLIAENALRILSVGGFFLSLSVISTHLLSMIGKSKLMLINLLIFSATNLILNAILVPLYGINGAAFSTMLCTIFSGIIFIFWANKYLNIIPLRRKMIRIFFISFIPTVLVLIIKQFIVINLLTLILIGVLFLAVYLLLIYKTGCFDKNDLMILKSIKNKIFWKK